MSEEKSEQHLVRLEKLNQLRKVSYPFPNDVRVSASAAEVIASAPKEGEAADENKIFTIAGRIMAMRLMGKAAFVHVQDRSGKVQAYIKRDDVGEEAFAAFKTFDLGDIIQTSGYSFITKTGEPSLHAKSVKLLVKCLHPLPEKWHGLSDVEIRYRQRYLDLIVNPEVKDAFIARAKILKGIREFFDARGYIEVETPILTGTASGAAAKPFKTHHNALDLDLQLRIAPELPLKRLVVGGLERVYELGRVFRNEGISTSHNPEFTMIEFYQAYATYEDLMDLTEELVSSLCKSVTGSDVVNFDGQEISFKGPWKRLTMADAIHEFANVPKSVDLNTEAGVRQAAQQLNATDLLNQPFGKVLYELYDRYVENKIIDPTFITQFPIEVSPLSRINEKDPRFVDRFELIVNGMELANAFSELNDAQDQQQRFEDQLKAKQAGDEEAMQQDDDYIRALEYGLPPTAGEGIGIDRLVMLLTGSKSIRDVILFPQMRPSEGNS